MQHFDSKNSQSAGLYRAMNQHPAKVIAVTGGKGGVGKTCVSANLAIAMSEMGRNVMVLDADLGLANIDVLLGLQVQQNLEHVIAGECGLSEIVVEGPHGIKVIPGGSGAEQMARLDSLQHAGLIRAFNDLCQPLDVLLIDTAAGIGDGVISFARAAQHVVVVVCDEPASITDAYAQIKVLSRNHGVKRFQILANRARSATHSRELFWKLARVADRFLDVSMVYMGYIPDDDYLARSVKRQSPVLDSFPSSISAQAFKKLARAADKWDMPDGANGHLEFFVERLTGQGKRESLSLQ